MEPGIKLKERHWIERLDRSRSGYADRHLVPSEHFETTTCARCAGLLVNEWCYDLENTGVHKAEVLRCVQCGYRVDPTIVHNRTQPSVRFQHSVNRERLKEAVSY